MHGGDITVYVGIHAIPIKLLVLVYILYVTKCSKFLNGRLGRPPPPTTAIVLVILYLHTLPYILARIIFYSLKRIGLSFDTDELTMQCVWLYICLVLMAVLHLSE